MKKERKNCWVAEKVGKVLSKATRLFSAWKENGNQTNSYWNKTNIIGWFYGYRFGQLS